MTGIAQYRLGLICPVEDRFSTFLETISEREKDQRLITGTVDLYYVAKNKNYVPFSIGAVD